MTTWADVLDAARERLDPERGGAWTLRPEPFAQLAVAAFALVLFFDAERVNRFFWWLNGANLLIHEFGHPFFSFLFIGNRFMMFVGGTLTQLAFPLLFYGDFLRRGMPKSADACLLWFGQNFLHIAPYVADARTQELPLVGGGEHDWHYLLGSFGLLSLDKQVSQVFNLAGAFFMAAAVYALCAHLKRKPSSGSALERALTSR